MQKIEQTNIDELLEDWRSAPYDGLKGMPPDWAIDIVVVDYMVHQQHVASAIFDGETSLPEVVRHLSINKERERLLREEDVLLEAHKHEAAMAMYARLKRLKLPKINRVSNSIAWLAGLHEDLKAGEIACRLLWLGIDGAENISGGQSHRDGGRKGGTSSGITRRRNSDDEEILRTAISLRKNGEARRGLAAKIKEGRGFKVTERRINQLLKDAKIK